MLADDGQALLPVGAHLRQEEIAEGVVVDGGERWARECRRHACLVELVRAVGRDTHADHGQPQLGSLALEQFSPHAVHADALELLGHGRKESADLDVRIALKC